MRDYISRRQKVAAKKNLRSAMFFAILTISTIAILLIFGIPIIVKYVGVLSNISSSNSEIETDDKTPPPPPTFQYFPETTKDKEVEIRGYSEPGVFVDLYVNSDKNEVLVDNDGRFTYKLNVANDEYIIEALSRDSSGNESKKVYGGKITFDNTPPEVTISSPNDGQEIYGSVNKQVSISGTTEPDSKLNINGRSVIMSSDGSFNYSFTLTEGTNTLNISAEDKAGNKTEKVLTIKYFL